MDVGNAWRKTWKVLAVLAVGALLVMWFRVVRQEDEILALVRNDVVAITAGSRTWVGSFVNTNDRTLRDVAVSVEFLDSQDRAVGRVEGNAAELAFGHRLDLQAPLPANAARMRIHSVRWQMGHKVAQMGPFREPWEFGYLMAYPSTISR